MWVMHVAEYYVLMLKEISYPLDTVIAHSLIYEFIESPSY